MKEQKFLYETTVKKQVKESVTEPRVENGQNISVTKEVNSIKPIKVAILKPDRKLFKGAEIFYSKTLADYLKAGLLPYSLVAKRYANDGGPLSDEDKKTLKGLRDESVELEAAFFKTIGDTTEATQKLKNELLIKINKINEQVSAIQNAYSDIFDSTAEMKARGDTIEWWSLFLIYIDENDKGYTCLFGDGTHEERLDKLEDIEETDFYREVIKKVSYLISFWFAARNVVTKIDFESMEKLYTDTLSDYKIEEPKPALVPEEPVKTPEPAPEAVK